MKTTNLYYVATYKRTNAIKEKIFRLFLALSFWFRVFIETFTRSHFGRRYYLFPLNIFLAILMALMPFIWSGYGEPVLNVIGDNFTWYSYIAAFVVFSFKRYQEIKSKPGEFEFTKFTQSAGIINKWFYNIKVFGETPSSRTIAIYLEPVIAMIVAIVLIVMQQKIGFLLLGSSFVYSLSWSAQYYLGDQFILDKIDEMICNEELVQSFVDNRPIEETRGFEFYGDRPHNTEFRRKMVDYMMDDEPAVEVI